MVVTTPPTKDELPDFAELFSAEENHFWFRTRTQLLETVVRDIVRLWPAGYRVLEIGCGTGNVLRMLEKTCRHGAVMGMDLHSEALDLARQRVTCPLVAADINHWPVASPFHLIGLFDVLEHLEDDARILGSIRERIHPGGTLLITVPACPSLWSDTDVYAGHYRRYVPRQLHQVLHRAGFDVVYWTPFMSALWPVMWLSRSLVSRFRKNSDDPLIHGKKLALAHLEVSPALNWLFTQAMSWERHIINRRKRLPLGTSLLAIARPRSRAVSLQTKAA